jgi:hypothetical protein
VCSARLRAEDSPKLNSKQEVRDEAELKRKQKQKWLTMEAEDADEKTDARIRP